MTKMKLTVDDMTREQMLNAIRNSKDTHERFSQMNRRAMLKKENARNNWHRDKMAVRDQRAIWIHENMLLYNRSDIEIVTVTIDDDIGFDKEEYTPTLQKVESLFDEVMSHVKLWEKLEFRKPAFVFYGEATDDKRPHIHGLCDTETADKIETIWHLHMNKGFLWRKPVGSLLESSRYIAKYGNLIQGSFSV